MNPVDSSAVPSVAASEKDAEQLTLNGEQYDDSTKEKIEEPASLQAAGPTACSVGQVGDDDFVEGGLEGWKVILGCALIAGPTVGWNLLWGVFQAYHSKFLLRGTPDATLSAVGSVQNAVMTGLAFVTGKLGDRYGYRGVTMLVGFSLIKTRFPTSQLQNKNRKIVWVDKQYFKDPKFWSFWAALLFAVFGYMTPFVYISVYTREKIPQISDQLANLPISIMAFASAIGRTTVGLTGDRIGFLNAFILAILISSFCQAVLWNVAAESYAGIMAFSVLFGMTGPCFVSLVTPVAVTLYGTHNLATLTGLLNISNMPGSLAGPPLGGVILEKSGRNWHALTAYSGVIQFVGVLCMLYARFKREPRIFARV
ncbi:unnamed protein product [Rhizoctonia solani]|uniref:Major facilitator superfamily (MFS) profile domain-containing protein n=1 Tax=Rhizoctonia solani TaxID=456999 RepID=A0A8H2ZZC6_9AGAM|nr:unnamed protein product [Rhizoctonia solani]